MSPRRSWYMRGIPPGKIVSAYRLHLSTRKVAKLLGLSARTVASVIRSYNASILLPPGGASMKGKPSPHGMNGSFARYVRAHPDVRFPRSVSAIVEMTGCTPDAIKCFLYRLRKSGKNIPYLKRKSKSKSSKKAKGHS